MGQTVTRVVNRSGGPVKVVITDRNDDSSTLIIHNHETKEVQTPPGRVEVEVFADLDGTGSGLEYKADFGSDDPDTLPEAWCETSSAHQNFIITKAAGNLNVERG